MLLDHLTASRAAPTAVAATERALLATGVRERSALSRRTARLIAAGLRDRPGLLTRWGLEPGWTGTDFSAPDTTLVTFTGPPLTAPPAAPGGPESRQFLWRLPDDGTPPEERAAGALRGLAGTDPRTLADP
ncbi:hypothetical protein [Streptomyces sp. NPDC126503]|uniref:hypothetical protein n=1 Tax=Streptomyces sp. NPDC126503 TaxID=3155315 RepID=UPI00331F7C2B